MPTKELAANRRYREFLSAIEDSTAGADLLNKISRKAEDAGRSYRGFNFFDDQDQSRFESLARGEFSTSGFQSKICASDCRIQPTARSQDC